MLKNIMKPESGHTYMTNRNPRNLELLKIAYRPDGYHLNKPGISYWNK